MISIERLSKRYGRTVALDGVSLTCEPGTVTALLGPDGSGRSTALRILLGLSRASDGRATVGGATYRELRNPGRVVGSSLDPAALHPGRTGRETLLLAAIATGVPTARVGDVLERVGLDHAGRRLVGQYSFAMRQRLGVAQALVGDPHVLVLDEPTSGLDVDGLAWLHGSAARVRRRRGHRPGVRPPPGRGPRHRGPPGGARPRPGGAVRSGDRAAPVGSRGRGVTGGPETLEHLDVDPALRPLARALALRGPSWWVLVRLELRKAVDTRWGRWLLVAVLLLAVGDRRSRADLGAGPGRPRPPRGSVFAVVRAGAARRRRPGDGR